MCTSLLNIGSYNKDPPQIAKAQQNKSLFLTRFTVPHRSGSSEWQVLLKLQIQVKKIQHHLSLQHSHLAKFWPGLNLVLCPFMFPGNHICLVCWLSQMIVSGPPFCPQICNNFSPIFILRGWPSFYLTKGKKAIRKQFLETSPAQLPTYGICTHVCCPPLLTVDECSISKMVSWPQIHPPLLSHFFVPLNNKTPQISVYVVFLFLLKPTLLESSTSLCENHYWCLT